MSFEIRDATAKDIPLMVDLINEAYWDQQKPFLIDTPFSRERINADGIQRILNDPTQKLFVLVDKVVAGVVLCELPKDVDYAKPGLFAVSKEYRGQKIGNMLVEHMENYARAHQRTAIKIEVFAFAEALGKHYESLGYKYTGKTGTFFHASIIKPEMRRADQQYVREMVKVLPRSML